MDLTSIMSGVDKTRGQRAKALMQNLGLTTPQQETPQTFWNTKVTPFKPYNGIKISTDSINKKINEIKKSLKKLNWDKLDDLIRAYVYAIYSKSPNSKQVVNQLKLDIAKELKIKLINTSLPSINENEINIYQKVLNIYNRDIIISSVTIGIIWVVINLKLDKFYARQDINITDKELDIKNEMRHIVGLAFLTKIFGAEKARKLGYLKEHWDIFTH